CGLGYRTNFPAAVSNNLALILRGTLTFADKASNAMSAGARAVIIFNNTNGNFLGTLGTSKQWAPVISLSKTDGLALSNSLPASGTVVNVLDPAMVYQLLDGTSMAAPHVSGAIAFAAMNFPTETVAQRIQRILTNVTPVAALAGKVATGGRLNLWRTVDANTNGLPDWWEVQYFGSLGASLPAADPDHDGANNLAEYLAGTNPTNATSVLTLAVASTASVSNAARLQWASVAGRYYRLLRGTNLLTGVTTPVVTNIAATPPLNQITNLLPATAPATFYRLQLEQ
ncbi:MAG TPA: PA domain-containing protein, partial [Verrucomicrobiae bacterium]